jgi:ABC-2 type transport system ATP-binding protein
LISIQNLCKSYGANLVLSGLTIDFIPGIVYGVVGRNGAGKTTLFECIAGLEKYSGVISYSAGSLKSQLGFLPTDPYMLTRITGREYLLYMTKARKLPRINFDEFNVFDLPLDNYAEYYSSGMKKKLALTAVLLQKNAVFILDEPFNGVDIQSNLMITQIIHKLKEMQKIVIVSTHIFSSVKDICDQLLLLDNGALTVCEEKVEFYKIENELMGNGLDNAVERIYGQI